MSNLEIGLTAHVMHFSFETVAFLLVQVVGVRYAFIRYPNRPAAKCFS